MLPNNMRHVLRVRDGSGLNRKIVADNNRYEKGFRRGPRGDDGRLTPGRTRYGVKLGGDGGEQWGALCRLGQRRNVVSDHLANRRLLRAFAGTVRQQHFVEPVSPTVLVELVDDP